MDRASVLYLQREREHLPRGLNSGPFIAGCLSRFQVSEVSRDPQDSPGSQEPAGSQETPVCRAGRARPSETKVASFRGLKSKMCAWVSCESHPSLVLCPFGWPERACARVVWMWSQSCCVLTRLDALLTVTRAVLSVSWLGGARASSDVFAKHSNSSRAVPWGQAEGLFRVDQC